MQRNRNAKPFFRMNWYPRTPCNSYPLRYSRICARQYDSFTIRRSFYDRSIVIIWTSSNSFTGHASGYKFPGIQKSAPTNHFGVSEISAENARFLLYSERQTSRRRNFCFTIRRPILGGPIDSFFYFTKLAYEKRCSIQVLNIYRKCWFLIVLRVSDLEVKRFQRQNPKIHSYWTHRYHLLRPTHLRDTLFES